MTRSTKMKLDIKRGKLLIETFQVEKSINIISEMITVMDKDDGETL